MCDRSVLTSLLVLALAAGLPETSSPETSTAELQVGPLIGDGMVLQREMPVAIWGTGAPEDEVSVEFRGASVSANADASGRWQVELPATSAGGPFEMTIVSGSESLVIRDVLVGDVWVCSGQSNMEWVVANSMNASAEIELAADLEIRHFKVPRSWAAEPADTLVGGSWMSADSTHVGEFTAVGYFFARDLRRDVDVPIGLINTTWGGSRIEPWMSAGALGMSDDDMRAILEEELEYEREVRTALAVRIGHESKEDRGSRDGRPVWADPDLDDSDWEGISVPSAWEAAGYPGMDGIAWYRTSFHLTAEEAAAGARLGLGAIDDSDVTWVNGHEVGRTELAWNEARTYDVPAEALLPGRNVLAVRVEDLQGGGGLHGPASLLYLEAGDRRRALAGEWKFAVGYFTVNLEDHKREVSAVLFNRMVHPLQRYPIKGVLWYQGESNADGIDDAAAYRELFPRLIEDWREGWGVDDLPFLWVQLANFMPATEDPDRPSAWAIMRESQSGALSLPATAQAVIIDVGDALDVHPTNKQTVGHRLAVAARGVAYGWDGVVSGPTYAGHEIDGDRILIAFADVGGGLVGRDMTGDSLRGFVIAGADRRFVWADAEIDGDRVVVRSHSVAEPVAVRYAWSDNPEGANLYNREGLPASPFRTDSW